MNDKTKSHGLDFDSHQQAAHDLPLICLLLARHMPKISQAYKKTQPELATAAQVAFSAMTTLTARHLKQAEFEYPEEGFELYSSEIISSGSPRITNEGEA